MDFLPNVKTLAGIVLLAFGAFAQMFHWDWYSSIAGDLEVLLSQIFAAVGTVLAIYGKAMSVRRERALKAELGARQ